MTTAGDLTPTGSTTAPGSTTGRRPHISDRARRRRLLRRHRLVDGHRASSVIEVADAMVGLHATTPSTVYLSAWARMDGFTIEKMDAALYADRLLIKQLAMRRTLFVFSRDVLPEAIGVAGPRVTASERTNLVRDLRRSEWCTDADDWIEKAQAAVSAVLADGSTLRAAEIRSRLSDHDRTVTVSPGKSYGGPSPLLPRILNRMSAAGAIVRGPNSGSWYLSRPVWSSMDCWLGEALEPLDPGPAHVALIRRWLHAFGPGTETDLVWWLGSTKSSVRHALAALEAVEVDLDDGSIGYVLPGDTADADTDTADDVAPQALLLPELDPTTMGHKIRDFYLGPHSARIFDRNGNGGQAVWWDGRIVGGWYAGADGALEVHLFEDLPADAHSAIRDRARDLTDWLGGTAFAPGFPAPFLRELR